MHESGGSSADKAVHQIAQRLKRAGIEGVRLPQHLLSRYRHRGFVAGWEFKVDFIDKKRNIRLLVPQDAPWSPVRVALVDDLFLKWPHVERDGVLCLRPSTWTFNPNLVGEAALEELALSVDLIESSITGENDEDFRDEFLTYWNLICRAHNNPVFCIASPTPPSRQVHVWCGKSFYLVGDTTESIEKWLQHRFPKILEKELTTVGGIFIWLDRPPTPAEFPDSTIKLKSLAAQVSVDLAGTVCEFSAIDADEILVILGAKAKSGSGFIGVSTSRNASRFIDTSIEKGFRKGKAPKKLVANRTLTGTSRPLRVERADASWVHGRDHDFRQAILQQSQIAILGCGSVGGYVADLLASAGVGNLLLIDPETLTWANVGRHVLGAEFVGKSKAESLAQRIGIRLPHVTRLEAEQQSWQGVMRSSSEKLTDCDLIISTMADWSSECHLNAWQMKQDSAVPVIYGWTEAYCCAGHGVLIYPGCACFQCGFSPQGVASFQVAEWPGKATTLPEPACGADFQPYGPVELLHVCAMIAEFALESLIEPSSTSIHKVWAGSKLLLESTGGQWTTDWLNTATKDDLGSRQNQRYWPKNNGCPACGWRVDG